MNVCHGCEHQGRYKRSITENDLLVVRNWENYKYRKNDEEKVGWGNRSRRLRRKCLLYPESKLKSINDLNISDITLDDTYRQVLLIAGINYHAHLVPVGASTQQSKEFEKNLKKAYIDVGAYM